jgi:chromosomal replication initiator protein
MKDITEKFLDRVKNRVSEQNFYTWFTPVKIDKIDFTKSEILFNVPNSFFIDWLQKNFQNVINDTLIEIFEQEFSINFQIKKSDIIPKKILPNKNSQNSSEITKQSGSQSFPKGVNPKYNFDRFIVGQFNQFAHAAATAVAKNPAKSYNPLFIYSGVGLGKTHLLNSIGNYIIQHYPSFKVAYLTSEDFTNDLVSSIREEKMFQFRNRYRSIDVLLIDDIQFIAGKQSTQEELFHTFNALYDANKQIVFTSDRSPKEIPTLENRLKTRFEWGLIADIQTPDVETLVAIINKKALELNLQINRETQFFLANNLPANIRTIEGALVRLSAFSSLEKKEIDEKFTKRVLNDILRIKEKDISIEYIQKVTAEFFGLKVSELKSKKKAKHIALARQVAMYLSRNLTKLSYPHIGDKFGKKDHSTVIHAENQIKKKIQNDKELDNKIKSLINTIKSNY